MTEPLVTTEENQSTIKRQSTANSSAKRLKPSPSQASPQGIDKRPKDEEWIEPVTTTASGHGDMESNGLLPPADATAQSKTLIILLQCVSRNEVAIEFLKDYFDLAMSLLISVVN